MESLGQSNFVRLVITTHDPTDAQSGAGHSDQPIGLLPAVGFCLILLPIEISAIFLSCRVSYSISLFPIRADRHKSNTRPSMGRLTSDSNYVEAGISKLSELY